MQAECTLVTECTLSASFSVKLWTYHGLHLQIRLGVAYMATGQWRHAIQALAKGVKLAPNNLAMVSPCHTQHPSLVAWPAVS